MNKVTMKSRATLIGKVFAAKGLVLSRSEQLDLVAQLEGARDWHHACSVTVEEAAPAMDAKFDDLQLEAAQAYCCGDFSYITDQAGLTSVGDTLFQFAISEIGEAAGDREEAVRMMRQGADELCALADAMESPALVEVVPDLALVSKQSEHAMYYEATTSKGKKLDWAIRLISDRFGDVNPRVASSYPHLADWVRDNPQSFDKMWSRCFEEMAFVAELNGQRGVLYEVEIVTKESEGNDVDGKPRCNVSEETRLIQLQREVAALELEHPNLQWAIGGPIGMADDRVGVWAFCPEYMLFTLEEVQALMESLFNKFYPS